MFAVRWPMVPKIVQHVCRPLADGTKLYRINRNDNDANVLQNAIPPISGWSNIWLLKCGVKKCKVIHVVYDRLNMKYQMFDSNN